MNINDLKEKYKDEWLAIKVMNEKEGEPLEGELLDHDKDKRELYDRLMKSDVQSVFTMYSGEIIKKGYECVL